ncbi:unnamed protein product [Amoebophrya sp. A120]|nr:unnamed protein product [Amoebophrya sp. A120]|eukprot:GSA120T00006125001.1
MFSAWFGSPTQTTNVAPATTTSAQQDYSAQAPIVASYQHSGAASSAPYTSTSNAVPQHQTHPPPTAAPTVISTTTAASSSGHRLLAPGPGLQQHQPRKVILVGDPQVGKTAVSCALTKRPFPVKYEATPASEFIWLDQVLPATNQSVRLCLYDCGFGGPDAALVLKGFFKNAHIALLVYDMTLADSFEGVKHWHQQMLSTPEECPNCQFVIVGTRSDVTHHEEVTEEIAEQYAKKHNVPQFRVSAKTGAGVDVLLDKITRMALSLNQQQTAGLVSSVAGQNVENSGTISGGVTSSSAAVGAATAAASQLASSTAGGGQGMKQPGLTAQNLSASTSSSFYGAARPAQSSMIIPPASKQQGPPTYRIGVLGPAEAGKSAFLQKLCGSSAGSRSSSYSATREVVKHSKTFVNLVLEHKDKQVHLEFFEGSGQETQLAPDKVQLNKILNQENCDAILYVADGSSVDSFQRVYDFQTLAAQKFGMSCAGIPQLLVVNTQSGKLAAKLPSSIIMQVAEAMGVMCSDVNVMTDKLEKLEDLISVVATAIYTWKNVRDKHGLYNASWKAFGILNSHQNLRFRSGKVDFLKNVPTGYHASIGSASTSGYGYGAAMSTAGSSAVGYGGAYSTTSGAAAPGAGAPVDLITGTTVPPSTGTASGLQSKKASMEDSTGGSRASSKAKGMTLNPNAFEASYLPQSPGNFASKPSRPAVPPPAVRDNNMERTMLSDSNPRMRSPGLDRTIPGYGATKPRTSGAMLSSAVIEDSTAGLDGSKKAVQQPDTTPGTNTITFEVKRAESSSSQQGSRGPPAQQPPRVSGMTAGNPPQQQQQSSVGFYFPGISTQGRNPNYGPGGSAANPTQQQQGNATYTQPSIRVGTQFQPSIGFASPVKFGIGNFARPGALSPTIGRQSPMAFSAAPARPQFRFAFTAAGTTGAPGN